MTGENVVLPEAVDRREQPFLYSWNRRARHLHGISLRNLNISLPAAKKRGKTNTDDEHNLKTPAKLLAVEEQAALSTSRSFSDLTKTDRPPTKFELKKAATTHVKNVTTAERPKMGALRRRSTMHWTGASPQVRQQKLEDVALNRLVDTWFSVHYAGFVEPVYISEIMHKSMNPSFSYFDLDATVAAVTRSDTVELKVWTKNSSMQKYRLLIDMNVNLRSLQFIGKTLDNFHHPLPENCVLFHLSDGIYTAFSDLPAEEIHEPQLNSNQKSIPPVASSSYDALMRLANLDDCIQDALHTRQKLEDEINALLAETKHTTTTAHVEEQREKVKGTKAALSSERKDVERLKKLKGNLEKSRDLRRQAMQEASQAKEDASEIPQRHEQSINIVQSDLDKLEEVSRGQIRRVCENMQVIFPIESIKNRTLQFTIRNIYLPNSVFDDTNRDEIAAALGFTAQFVSQLSMYLSIPLPYEIEANASSSFIMDNVSMSLAQRRFPLHPTNVNYKFEYGVFLLNKNIEFMMNRVGLRALDIRHTLPNLKYLLFVLTAGNGELPGRKMGGVRGLLGGVASPSLSRRSSDDSTHSRHASMDGVNESIMNALAKGREKSPDAQGPLTGPGRTKGLPYRHSLLREAG